MNRQGGDNKQQENERRVLLGHRKKGKRFIPPILDQMPVSETNWIDDIVPELVWIALLIHAFGVQRGTAVALSIAKAAAVCDQTANRAFAAIGDYAELSANQKQCVRLALNSEGALGKARLGLESLIYYYAEFPLAFLANPDDLNEVPSRSTLDDLREAIDNIIDRQGHAGTFAQATAVYIYFVNNQLTVSPGLSLANLPAIEEYPRTDESRRVAASVRSAVSFLFKRDTSSDWRNSFWTQGRSLSSCELAG